MSYSGVDQTSQGKNGRQRWQHILADYFELPVQSWQQGTLLVIFALLLLLVVVCCTEHFSPFLSVALVAGLGVAVLAMVRP
ncbi:MAG: hypothetical protein JO011_18000, partial [Ktedonobacteraceae bacterium]|nr:hypothetical protein [Ktedonobacteraceae bacterium]